MNKTLKPLKAHFSKDKKFIILNFKQDNDFYSVVKPVDYVRCAFSDDCKSVGLFFDVAENAEK